MDRSRDGTRSLTGGGVVGEASSSMGDHDGWQVSSNAAEVYEQYWVPAMLAQWAPRLVDVVEVAGRDRVLDVACGTGLVARHAASRLDSEGVVVGVDINVGMLEVARRLAPELDWRVGDAMGLPFDDGDFDVVLCQFALMYFADRVAALREMHRVLQSGGRVGAVVWASFERATGYVILAQAVQELAGEAAAALLRGPHELGKEDLLVGLLHSAGFNDVRAELGSGTQTHPSVERFVTMEVKGTPLEAHVDDTMLDAVIDAISDQLKSFETRDGALILPMDAVIVTARKP